MAARPFLLPSATSHKMDVMAGALVATLEHEVVFRMKLKEKRSLEFADIVQLPYNKTGLAPFVLFCFFNENKPLCV
jgi:hypothetical protein